MGDKKKKRKHSHSESEGEDERKKRKHSEGDEERKKKKKKHRHSDDDDEKRKKHKHKKHKKKHKKDKRSEESKSEIKIVGPSVDTAQTKKEEKPEDTASSRNLRPMTKEEWDKQQSVVRHVFDPQTGRTRLVKGDGEILEEIVSRERQKEINKQATAGDGASFQKAVGLLK